MASGGLRRALGAVAAAGVGALFAGALSGVLRHSDDRMGGLARETAMHVFLAIPAVFLLLPLALLVHEERLASVRAALEDPPSRSTHTRASLLVLPALFLCWVAALARLGRVFLTAFHHVGLAALAQAVTFALVTFAFLSLALAAVRMVALQMSPGAETRRLIASAAGGIFFATLLFAYGIYRGDTNGVGGLFGVFAVLKKPELDLWPVYSLLLVVLGGVLVLPLSARSIPAGLMISVLSFGTGFGLLGYEAKHFGDAPSAATIEARPSLARIVLRFLRKRTDRDHDGHSALFGGGDCDDHDARRNPDAVDVPGNRIDEDCSGSDARPVAPPPPPAPREPSLAERIERTIPRDANLLFITVDTLRWDLHYAGNPRELSPNLDRLAARSIVFDQAYALSSYTGRAIGPIMTGRYPTECPRDAEHFTRYLASNVFLAERLKERGFHTFGAASHFYFERRFGLAQGMDEWDLSAEPGGGEQETTAADHRVADRALAQFQAQLARNERFFQWVHFFDPHKQYVPHPELPSFGNNERARYDGEVAWTDRQIGRLLDALAASPAAAKTVVIITADHGEAFGEHGMAWHGVELWEELVRVPMLVYIPGVAPRHITVPRSQIDLAPTILELLRIPAPANTAADAFSGVSLVPEFFGAPQTPRTIYLELPEGPFNSLRRGVIDDGWKLLQRGSGRFLLYHLATDPAEREEVSAREPEQLARMRSALERVRSTLHLVEPNS